MPCTDERFSHILVFMPNLILLITYTSGEVHCDETFENLTSLGIAHRGCIKDACRVIWERRSEDESPRRVLGGREWFMSGRGVRVPMQSVAGDHWGLRPPRHIPLGINLAHQMPSTIHIFHILFIKIILALFILSYQ